MNDLNMERDVMRYDKPNKATGSKSFQNLDVDVLKLDKNINVQDVDIIDFTTKAVLKDGNFKIEGKSVIERASFDNGLR